MISLFHQKFLVDLNTKTLSFTNIFFIMIKMAAEEECSHNKVELIGVEKAEISLNRYFRCLKCGQILVLSESGELYEVEKAKKD